MGFGVAGVEFRVLNLGLRKQGNGFFNPKP